MSKSVFKFLDPIGVTDPAGLVTGETITENLGLKPPKVEEPVTDPDVPKPETPDEKTALDAAAEAEAEKARRRASGGRRGTILTGPLGRSGATVERKTLLGG